MRSGGIKSESVFGKPWEREWEAWSHGYGHGQWKSASIRGHLIHKTDTGRGNGIEKMGEKKHLIFFRRGQGLRIVGV